MATVVADVREILVRVARDEARSDGSSTIEAEHLLLAVVAQRGAPAQRLLAASGLDRGSVRDALDGEYEQSLRAAGLSVTAAELPQPSTDRDRNPKIGASAKLVLERAMAATSAHGGGRIGLDALLVGILAAEIGRVPRALAVAGVDRAELLARATAALGR